MISISNADAKAMQQLMEHAAATYRDYAMTTRDVNRLRRMAVLARKLKRKVNRAAAQQRPQINK